MNAMNKTLRNALLAVLLAAPLAAPAQPFTADLTVTLAPLSDRPILSRRDPNVGQITYGQKKVHVVTITNDGPSTATGVRVNFPTVDSHLKITKVTGCSLKESFDPITSTTAIHPNLAGSWPCKVSDIPGPVGLTPTKSSAEVDIQVEWQQFVSTVCPNAGPGAITLGTTSVTIASDTVNANPTTVTDTPVAGALANLNIGMTSSTYEGGPGTPFTVRAVVENTGPCVAPDVRVADRDGISDTKMSFVSSTGCLLDPTVSTTVEDNTVDPFSSPPCFVGDLAVGGTHAVTSTYVVGAMASGELQRGTIVNYNAYTLGRSYFVNRPASGDGRVYDPDESDNAATVYVISKQDVSSCATGGLPLPLGLVALGLLALRRRRR